MNASMKITFLSSSFFIFFSYGSQSQFALSSSAGGQRNIKELICGLNVNNASEVNKLFNQSCKVSNQAVQASLGLLQGACSERGKLSLVPESRVASRVSSSLGLDLFMSQLSLLELVQQLDEINQVAHQALDASSVSESPQPDGQDVESIVVNPSYQALHHTAPTPSSSSIGVHNDQHYSHDGVSSMMASMVDIGTHDNAGDDGDADLPFQLHDDMQSGDHASAQGADLEELVPTTQIPRSIQLRQAKVRTWSDIVSQEDQTRAAKVLQNAFAMAQQKREGDSLHKAVQDFVCRWDESLLKGKGASVIAGSMAAAIAGVVMQQKTNVMPSRFTPGDAFGIFGMLAQVFGVGITGVMGYYVFEKGRQVVNGLDMLSAFNTSVEQWKKKINELQKQVKELQASNVGLQHAVNNTIAITEEVQEHIGALAGLSTDQVTLATLVHDMARDAQQQQKLLQEVSERLVAFIAQSGLDEEQKENLLQSLVPPLQVSSDAQASAGQAVSVLEQQRRVIEHYNKQNFISRFFSSPKPLKTFSQIPVDWLQKHKEWIEKHGCNDICKMRTALV